MSWFTEIAGKAEDFLNKVDQTAATTLQKQGRSSATYNPDSPFHKQSHSQAPPPIFSTSSSTFSGPLRPSASTSSLSSPTTEQKATFSSGSRKKPESDDEKLLRFLNSSDVETAPNPKKSTSPKKIVQKMDAGVSENLIVKDESSKSKSSSVEIPTLTVNMDSNNPSLNQETFNKATSAPFIPFSASATPVGKDESLPSEQELQSAQKRAQHAESELKRMTRKLDHWNSQISGNDKVARELREREKDMTAAMDAKDSQLAILKVRLHEADQELTTRAHIIEELTSENDRIIKDHAQSAAFQNKTIEVIQAHLQETENELKKTKDFLLQIQNEHMQKIDKMEEEHRHLAESYSTLQKKWNELNENSKDLSTQFKQSNSNMDILQQEYNDYKQKAQRILQSKEKLISSLKEDHLEADSIEKTEAASLLLNAEIESVKQERDLLRDELRRSSELTETFRSEIQELEKMSQNEMLASQDQIRVLQEQLSMERLQREEVQLMNQQMKEETQSLHEDLARTKSTFQSRVQDREIEIEKLRRQLTAKSLSTVSQDELESRLHALTENLIQKQTFVEALSTEKNSLVLQLERLEQQLRAAQNFGVQQHTFIGINNNEQEKKLKTVFLENPFDSTLTRKVKRVYGSIDSLSIRMGVFFRRYPITRVFVIIYMLLLHFWVMIVLLTYEPEVHNISYEDAKIKVISEQ